MMLDQAIRVGWLDTCWREILKDFGRLFTKPGRILRGREDACVTVGYPPLRARGKRDERRGGYISTTDWKGNNDERAFVTVHPERMKDGITAAKALFTEAYRITYGTRQMHNGFQEQSKEYDKKLKAIVDRIGEPPPGFAKMQDPTPKQRARLRKYECACKPDRATGKTNIIRAATDKLKATCDHCSSSYQLVK